MRVVLVVLVVALASPQVAMAGPIVIESYTGKRPDDATQLLAPLHEELAGRGYTSGDSLGRKYEARASRPATTPDGLAPDFESQVERGHKAWVAGRFDEAVSILVPQINAAQANAAAIAQNQALRQSVLEALTALALSQQRKGDLAAARDTFQEMLRSFPDAQISRATYGPDAYQFFEDVRRDLGKSGRGRLSVKVSSTSAVVFINERFENVGSLTKGDLLPGTYRVFVQIAKQASRVHKVEVKPEDETVLALDPAFEATLRTTGPATGFVFSDQNTRDKNEPGYAARFANEVGASAVAVVGIDMVRGRPALVGSVVDLQSTKEIRRASLTLDPVPTVERIRSLAGFLAGEAAAEGLVVEIGAEPEKEEEEEESEQERGSNRSWMLWTGIGGVALGAVGGGLAIKFALDAKDASAEYDRVCAVSCTSEQALSLERQQKTANRNAIISAAAGGAIVVTGAVFIVLSRMGGGRSNSVAVVPTTGGVYTSYTHSF